MKKGKPNTQRYKHFLFVFLFLSSFISSAQIEITPATTGIFTPESLVTNVFLGDGVEVLDLEYSGADEAVGYFTNGLGSVGIERGILLTTGDAELAQGRNDEVDIGSDNDFDGNPCDALDNIASTETFNTAFYTITFIPTADTLRFNYVFASEEYPEFACNQFNDAFGFFITGPNPNGGMYNQRNIALVPDPADPSGEVFTNVPVTINNVNPNGLDPAFGCNFTFDNYYNDNAGGNNMQYDGYLDVFIAQAIVVPCQEYTMKLAVADVSDPLFDTGVFLEAKSFGTGTLAVEANTVSLDGAITEGCTDGVLSFTLPNPAASDFQVDYTIFGTATNGVDYEFIPTDLTIPAGEKSISVPIIAFEDMLTETTESIGFDVQRDVCNRDTFWVFIRDNEIVDPELGPDRTICSSSPIALDGTLNITLPPPPNFSFEGSQEITHLETTESEIQVFGVQPTILSEGVLKQVCIDTLIHSFDDDLQIYLVTPSGQFLELTTGNGADGDNYIGTCFTPSATTIITEGGLAPNSAPREAAPFTGDFLPEGNFSDLWDGENATNGTWKLIIQDKFNGSNGDLRKWSVCFESIYKVQYVWSPITGLDCFNCPNPNAAPNETTTYTLTATDSYGCVVTDEITIFVEDQLPAPLINCTDISNNSITFSWDAVSGLSGSYEVSLDGGITWSPANNGMLSHISGGHNLGTNVAIQVRAIGTCDGSIGTQQCMTSDCNAPTLSIVSTTPPSCFGGTDGTIALDGSGANGPFTFTLGMNTSSNSVFSGLSAGVYNASITDDLSCTTSMTISLGQPDSITTTPILIETINCFGDNNGSATVVINGGTYPYDFNWGSSGTGLTDSIVSGLTVGNYNVTITDTNGCIANQMVTIDGPEMLNLSLSTNPMACSGPNDGVAMSTVTGGTAPYTYLWSDGQTTSTATDLSEGIYTLVVTDVELCTVSADITIDDLAPLIGIITTRDVFCYDGTTGTATIDVSGGASPYNYNWNNDQNTQTATDLSAGIHFVTVSDANNCLLFDSVEIFQPTEILATIDFTDVSCNGASDGTATVVNPTGGSGEYTYLWLPSFQVTQTAVGLTAETYSVFVIDSTIPNPFVCSTELTITINEPDSLKFEPDITDVTCLDGSDGAINITPSGGSGSYNFLWDNGETTANLSGLSIGEYSLTITDTNMCTFEMEMSVGQAFEPLIMNILPPDIICFGSADGIVNVDISSVAGRWSEEWSDGQVTNPAIGLVAGTYQITVTDVHGCPYIDSVTIEERAEISTTIITTGAICNGGDEGTATVDEIFFGGVSVNISDYNINWSDGQSGITALNLVGGESYMVSITDQSNCSDIITFTIDHPAAMTATITDRVDIICSDDQFGAATVSANGGTAPYNYLWDNNANSQVTQTATDLSVGIYTVTINDANNCTATTSVEIQQPNPLLVDVEGTNILCKGQPLGTANSMASGGSPPYTYQWSDGSTDASITALLAGTYEVTIMDTNDCSVTEQVIITEPDEFLLLEETHANLSCWESGDGILDINPMGGTPPYTYSINGNAFNGTDLLPALDAGDYIITIKDGNDCIHQHPDTVNIFQPFPIEVNLFEDETILFGEIGFLNSEVINHTGQLNYFWSPADSLTCLDCPNPSAIGLQFQTSYTLTVVDENGCEADDVKTIFVRQDRKVFVPTGFSPNGDGINDLLYVVGQDDVIIDVFTVFDRWGEMVHQSLDFDINDASVGWDGNFRSKKMPTGLYYWTAEVSFTDGTNGFVRGQVTLLR